MPTLSNHCLIFFCPFILIFLWSFSQSRALPSFPNFAPTGIMNSLPSSFTIVVNGNPIASVGSDAEHGVQATTGADAAVFTLKDGRLQCDDRFLGRSMKEDRSFLPKPVLWFKSTEGIRPVTASEKGDSYQLRFSSMCLRRGIVLCSNEC
jgi:hypothetical protein